MKSSYILDDKNSIEFLVNWRKEYLEMFPDMRVSNNRSGKTLPIVPWVGFSSYKNRFGVTILFSVESRTPFISIQSSTDGKSQKEIAKLNKIGSLLLENETVFKPNDLDLQSGKASSPYRPKNYEKVSIISEELTQKTDEQILSKIIEYTAIASFLNKNNPENLYENNAEANEVLEMVETGVSFAEVKVRVGQAKWKRLLLKRFNNRCAICGIDVKEVLIGSHIVGWSENDKTKGDLDNGLILCANHDALFDKKMISFNSSGNILISKDLMPRLDKLLIGVDTKISNKYYDGTISNVREYMKQHEIGFMNKDTK